jgi:hypothetical protein
MIIFMLTVFSNNVSKNRNSHFSHFVEHLNFCRKVAAGISKCLRKLFSMQYSDILVPPETRRKMFGPDSLVLKLCGTYTS